MTNTRAFFSGILLCALSSSALASVTSGVLRDEPKANSAFIIADQPTLAKVYEKTNQHLTDLKKNGPQTLAALRDLEADEKKPLKSVDILVTKAMMKLIDPKGEHRHVIDFSVIPGLEWLKPLIQYTYEEESGEKFYEKANRELRRGPFSEEIASWSESMRVALGRLPRFAGLSFRGARLSAERIERYYAVGKQTVDPGFFSTSLSPAIAFKFAKLYTDRDTGKLKHDGQVAVVFIIRGKSGRPVSKFAYLFSDEKEILFANGTPFKVVARSPIFDDTELASPTMLVLIEEQ